MEERKQGNNHAMPLAIAAGIFATTGSLFGKFAGGADVWFMVILLVLMVASNTAGCTLFVKALHRSGSSLPVTITSTATNYICSVVTGLLFFGESTSFTWWCGTFSILLGLVLICNVQAEPERKLKQR